MYDGRVNLGWLVVEMVGCGDAKKRIVAAVGKKTGCAAEGVKLSWVRLEQTFDRS